MNTDALVLNSILAMIAPQSALPDGGEVDVWPESALRIPA
jgi:hypothetical protein